MSAVRTTKAAKAKKASAKATSKKKGTERWPAACLAEGEFILVPKSILQSLPGLEIKPQHLWLLLALQSERYRDRPPRYYWEELAEWAGVSKDTVRRWGRELKESGLLNIKQNRKPNPGANRRPGHRNERNEFYLDGLEVSLLSVHHEWRKKKRKTR